MIPNQNFEIYASVILFVVVKILRAVVRECRASMYDKKALACIPEKNSDETTVKWVPKKKHEVLKAKYKCLKKLFQIYDASLIGILPENQADNQEEDSSHRRRRSHRTKTDASAGTTEESVGDISVSTTESSPVSEVIKEINIYASTQVSQCTIKKEKIDKSTQESKEDTQTSIESINSVSDDVQTFKPYSIPYHLYNGRRKLSRFQSFINRIFGIRFEERRYNILPFGGAYALSDNMINKYEKRKRRGLRFRRRRPRRVHTEIPVKSPMMSYAQLVQRNCLIDTTPRHCPVLGCKMILYGIINYNDHLNLCHFNDRQYICHYCHEGFTSEYDRLMHKNDHFGITKLASNLPRSPSIIRETCKIASNTQTDPELSKSEVSEDKLKKIVSFFDKISDPDQVIDRMNKTRASESQLQSSQRTSESDSTDVDDSKSTDSGKGKSFADFQLSRKALSSTFSDRISNSYRDQRVSCRFCGEKFEFRRQLSLHVDLEHRAHDKFSKFHSCTGVVNSPPAKTANITSKDSSIDVHSVAPDITQSLCSDVSRMQSVATAGCAPSASVVYYASVASMVKKPSHVGGLVQKIRSFKWEPGTKVIRV